MELAIHVLVVQATEYSLQVPILIGTNVIRECRKLCDYNIIPDELKMHLFPYITDALDVYFIQTANTSWEYESLFVQSHEQR